MTDQSEKFKLFESDDEEVEASDDFKIRPQYEGPHGQDLLEFNSLLPERFKLDERFSEDLEDKTEESEEKVISEDERKKNMRILESILGHEISSKTSDKSFTKKKQIRYDPDDENASKFIKTSEGTSEKLKKSKKKKKAIETEAEPIPISTERYIEVCPDLKEVLNTSTPFTFSQKFNLDDMEVEENVEENVKNDISTKTSKEGYYQDFEKKPKRKMNTQQNLSTKCFTPKSRWDTFFIAKGDPRLKEGIEFFKRPKPLEDIRVDWQKKREYVLELFRRKKRSGQRSYSTRVKSVQIKNSIRKKNFNK